MSGPQICRGLRLKLDTFCGEDSEDEPQMAPLQLTDALATAVKDHFIDQLMFVYHDMSCLHCRILGRTWLSSFTIQNAPTSNHFKP